jgi:hypothetical protein
MNEALVTNEVWVDGGLDSSRLVDKVCINISLSGLLAGRENY